MKAFFVQEAAQPGKAVLRMQCDAGEEYAFSGNETFSLQRADDRQFMCCAGEGQWAVQEDFIAVPSRPVEGGTEFFLPPLYVNFLRQGTYRVRIGEPCGMTARLRIDSVIAESMQGGGSLAVASESAPPVPEQPAETSPPVEEEKAVLPDVELPKPAEPGRGGKGYIAAGVIAALLLVGGGAGWYLYSAHLDAEKARIEAEAAEKERLAAEAAQREKEAAEQALKERLEAEKKAAEERERRAAEEAATRERERLAAEAEAKAAAARADARGRVKEYFASPNRTPEGAFALSRELDTQNAEQQDAVFRLLYFAASRDYAEAMVPYAACIDPAKPQWGSTAKDGAEAWQYYRKAGASNAEADAAMKNLKAWAEKAAASGDRKAAEWLKEMK